MILKKKLRAAFALFLVVTVLSGAAGVLYLQSEGFANSIKRMISERSDQKLGIVGDFKNVKLYFFPPGIGVAEPVVTIQKENITKIPVDAKIEAKEIIIRFAPIQMFSGTLVVDEFKVVGGSVIGELGSEIFKPIKKPKNSSKLSWTDLFQLQINGIYLEDTYLHLDIPSPMDDGELMGMEFVVKSLALNKATINGKQGFQSQALVSAVKLDIPKNVIELPVREAYQVQWNAQWNDEALSFSPLSVDIEGLNLKLQGKVNGNLLSEKAPLKLDAEAQLSSDLNDFFSAHLQEDNVFGSLVGSARLTANLRDFENTLRAAYQLTGKEVAWKEMKVSYLHSDGVVDLPSKQIEVKNANLLAPNDIGLKNAEPGELTIENTTIPLKLNLPFSTKLKLKNADLHWLGGAAIKEIFMLEGLVGGEVTGHFTPAKPGDSKSWKFDASTNLEVTKFGLTNQKFNKVSPKHYVLKPLYPVKLSGDTSLTSKGIDFNHMTLQLIKSKFDVTGGVHEKIGFQILGKGPVDLKEINEIAETPIRGVGDIAIFVHGPSSNVLIDFDAELKDTEYIDLKLGDIKGKIVYDDDLSEIKLLNLKAKQRSTFYSLDEGYISLESDELHLPVAVRTGRVEDLSYILGSLVKKIDWFPTTLLGEVHGSIDVGGKIDLPLLEIKTHLEGTDWEWMQEKARSVKLDFAYDRGVYSAKNVNLIKTTGQVLGDIEFNSKNDQMIWNFHTENFTLNDIDLVDRLEVPARSKIEVKSVGQGKLSQLQSSTEGRMFETVLKGDRLEPTVVVAEMGEKTFRLKLDVFGHELQSQVKYAFTPKQPSQFSLDLNDFDFSPIIMVLNPKLMDDPELVAKVDGHIQLDFLSTQSELARGSVTINSYLLKKNGFFLKLVEPIELPIQLGYFSLKPSKFQFKNSDITIQGEGDRGNVELTLAGKLDLALAEFFSSSIQKVQGTADTAIRFYGPMKSMKVTGDIQFEGVYALMRWMQTPFEEIDGSVRLRQGTIYLEGIESYLADQLFSLSGAITTFTDRFPKLDIKANFEDNRIKMLPLDYAQVRGTAWLHGESPPYAISGNLDISQALYTKSFSSTGLTTRGERFAPSNTQRQNQSHNTNSMFNLDLNTSSNSFTVRNEILDAEFRGRGKLLGPPENPTMIGEANLVQGKILFRDRPFNLESAKVTFDDPLQFNPRYSIAAISEVNQYKIRLLVSGRGSTPKAEFSSSPYLPENEIYSLLTSGLTSQDTGRFKTKDRTYVNQGEAASLILHSMDFSQDVQRKTGFQFDVQEAVDAQSANSIFRPHSPGENVAAPKLVLKRNVGRNINVSFGSTVGVGNETIREVNTEYKLTPGLSFIGVWNSIEDTGASTDPARTSYGLDIRVNKKFK